jgi:chromosome segregation ATPase
LVAAFGVAGICLLLSVVVVAVERHRRIEVARVRAQQSAAYNKLHAAHSAEHVEFVRYLRDLLDERDNTVVALRTWLSETRKELARLRDTVGRAEAARDQAERRADLAHQIAAEAEDRLAAVIAGNEVLRSDALTEDAECVAPEPPLQEEPLVDVDAARVAAEDLDVPLRRTA